MSATTSHAAITSPWKSGRWWCTAPPPTSGALSVAIGFAGIATFEVALAAGARWGHAAWDGVPAKALKDCPDMDSL
jgi:hypothetical protein